MADDRTSTKPAASGWLRLTQKMRSDAFSPQSSVILDERRIAPISKLIEIDLLENGGANARERWVAGQLAALMAHARTHSAFWRKRLNGVKNGDLSRTPPLQREELAQQVSGEGCLPLSGEHGRAALRSTSGSTGRPTSVFVSDMNGAYNELRSIAQCLWDGVDLEQNRLAVRIRPVNNPQGYTIQRGHTWGGPLQAVFATGSNRILTIGGGDPSRVLRELAAEPIGLINAIPSFLREFARAAGARKLRQLGVKTYVALGERIDEDLQDICAQAGIAVHDTYSSEEIGAIGFSCARTPGAFHIATSNVVVESVAPFIDVGGEKVGTLLVTHLHSYATPLIRYALGDIGQVAGRCACGHGGPTITRLQGRLMSLLKLPSGERRALIVRTRDLMMLADVREFRLRQTQADLIVLELVTNAPLSEEAREQFERFIVSRAGPEFRAEARALDAIDWGPGPKRLDFRCEV